ncbi:MAG: hypothetical protein L6422_10225, partial [Candidatus Marinimicrobia bacterium]|nr:hypothetical protein [Candidatus Neomarinimicrobiota bacterium]
NKKTLKELVKSAPLIVFGKVLEVNPQVEEYLGQDDFIITYVKLSVQTILKGNDSEQILTIKIPGGQIGDRVIGGERSFPFTKNEKVLLFLNPIDKNYHEIYSISGKLSIEEKEDGEYLDCSLLKEDEISKYGPNSTFKFESIVSRIESYIAEIGGEGK